MNTLTWGIYIAAVIGDFSILLVAAAFGATIAIGLHFLVWANRIEWCSGKEAEDARIRRDKSYKYLIIPLVLGCITVFVPSTRTVHMMLGSEVAERVSDAITPEAKEIYNILKDRLKHGQLESTKVLDK